MSEKIKVEYTLFMNMEDEGFLQQMEAVDFPGICITRKKEDKGHPIEVFVELNGVPYVTIAAAIEAWKANKAELTPDD